MTLIEYYVVYFGILFAGIGVGLFLIDRSARRLEREFKDKQPPAE